MNELTIVAAGVELCRLQSVTSRFILVRQLQVKISLLHFIGLPCSVCELWLGASTSHNSTNLKPDRTLLTLPSLVRDLF